MMGSRMVGLASCMAFLRHMLAAILSRDEISRYALEEPPYNLKSIIVSIIVDFEYFQKR